MAGINRYFIRLGDKTTHGGTVVSAWGRDCGYPDDILGIYVACIGDYVTCPLCKGTHQIVQGDSVAHRRTICGRVVASTADFTTCGAQLLASQSLSWYVDESWVDPIVVAVQTRKATAAQAARGIQTASATPGISAEEARLLAEQQTDKVYKIQFKVLDGGTGEPIRNRYYSLIRDQGSPNSGVTDSEGMTDIVESNKPESVGIRVNFQAPAKTFTRDELFTPGDMSDLKQSEFLTKVDLIESTKDAKPKLFEFKINDKAATRQAIIASLRNTGVQVKTRSDWNAKPGPKPDGPDWNYYGIAIHHAGNSYEITANNIEQIKKLEETDIKKSGHVSYHYIVTGDGMVYEGLDIREKGAHIQDGNTGKIGICLLADLSARNEAWEHEYSKLDYAKKETYEKIRHEILSMIGDKLDVFYDEPTPAMVSTLSALVNILISYFKVTQIGGHREYQPIANGERRACPGVKGMELVVKLRASTGLVKP